MHAAFYVALTLFGFNPAGYHLISLLLHAAVSAMVFLVVREFYREPAVPFAAALLFAAHPIHVEAVAWISAYPELMCSFFSLLAIWLHLRADTRRWMQVSAGLAFLLALLAKEIAVAAPLVLLCYELIVRRQRARFPSVAWLSMGAAIAIYTAMRVHALGTFFPAGTRGLPLDQHFWTAVAVCARYLWVQLWPVELRAFYYISPSRSQSEPWVIAGLVTIVGTVALGWFLYRRSRSEALAVPLYLLTLAPAFVLPYASLGLMMAERYAYLPSVGFCWLAAAGLFRIRYFLSRRWRRALRIGALALIVALLSVRTVTRNRDWHNEVEFYERAIGESPGFARAHLNLGEALMRRNRLPEARQATLNAARLDGNYAEPHVNLGLIHWREGNQEAAIEHSRRGAELALRAGNTRVASRALTNLAIVYRGTGRLEEAVAAGRRAVEIDPFFAGGHNNLGYALLTKGDVAEAIQQFQVALQLDPTLEVTHSNLGLAYATRSQWDQALKHLQEAERLNPGASEVHARIGEVLLSQGKSAEAVGKFRLALRLDSNNERARAGLAAATAKANR